MRRSGCNISYGSAREYMRAAGIKTYRLSSIGHRMDWRLPNKALAQVWGQRKDYVARLKWVLGARKARWDSRRKATYSDPAYLRAVAAERKKAEAVRAVGPIGRTKTSVLLGRA